MIVLEGEKICMPEPCVLGIGKFECFHLGHRALVSEMMWLVRHNESTMRPVPKGSKRNPNHDIAGALVMFEPHPYQVLIDPSYKPLFTGLERERLAEGLGVDFLLKYPFNKDFAAMPPEDFCRMVFEDLKARVVVVGMGYRFGYRRMGTVDTLREVAGRYGAVVHAVAQHGALGGEGKTSTSTIRDLLSAGKLAEAEGLLGYPFFAIGDITPGRQIGRTIGFPTINLYPNVEKFLPGDGVYVTSVSFGDRSYAGVTNIGFRPTVRSDDATRTIETHLLDFEGRELYGQEAKVEFLRFVRPERKFESLEALKAQILLDCDVATAWHLTN